jgi:hypothetical protein
MSKLGLISAAVGIVGLSLLACVSAPGAAHAQAAIVNALQRINDKLDAQVVPFKVTIAGGLCDSAGDTTSNPRIAIDSDGTAGEFVVTSILLKTTAPGIPETGFRDLTLNYIRIDGEQFDTRTANLLGPTDGSGVLESADILGTPVRRSGDHEAPPLGGNVPHQIVAQSAEASDVELELFCSTTDQDISFDTILVAGWKRPADSVTVTYVPGT